MRFTQAPFEPEQVESINGFQEAGLMHPFTCPCDHHDESVLVATVDAMVCPDDDCEYRQSWVHDFMADGSWSDILDSFPEVLKQAVASARQVVDTKPL